MNARGMWYSFALLLLAPLLAGVAAEKDPYGDPLPEGAKARVGTARLRVNMSSPLLSPDGASLYTQSGGGLARLDPATGDERSKVPTQYYVPHEFSSDGKRALYRGYDEISVWDTETGKTITKVAGRRLPGSDAAAVISGDGKTLVLGGSADRTKKEVVTLLVWDIDKSKEISKITVPQNDYASVAVSRDGKVVASWGSFTDPNPQGEPDTETNPTRFVNFWNAADGKELSKFRSSGYMPASVVLNNDGSVAAVANGNSSIDLVDPKTGASKQLLLGRNRIGRTISFSPDGSTIAAATDDGTVQMWKVADGSRLSTTEPPTTNIYSIRVQLLSNEKGLVSATKGSAVIVWEVPSGKLISPAGGHTGTIRGIAVAPDNKHFVTSAEDGAMLKWELETGKPAGAVTLRPPYPGFSTSYQSAIFAPNFHHALLRDYNGLSVFDIATLTQQYVIPTPSEGFTTGTFSPDGSQVIISTSSYDPKKRPARVSVWNVATSKRITLLELPGIGNVSAAVTPDGKHIVTASRKPADKGNGDFFVTAWDTATGTKKGEYREEAGYGTPFVTTAPDNKTAVAATSKGELASFDLVTGKLARPLELKGRPPGLAPVFSADGKKLAVVCQADFGGKQTATILVYDWETGKVKHTFSVTGGTPACAIFTPDGKRLITGSPDTTATVWDVSQ